MLLFGARRRAGSRLQTLRELYASFIGENSPEARGRHLLRAWLSPVQLAQFDEHQYFDVVGCDTAKRYRINYGTAANVHELDGAGTPRVGRAFSTACARRRDARAEDCSGNQRECCALCGERVSAADAV
ncbi:hypothetical protein N2603_36545 [Bradyrhizobium huanghuaihaiense]|nr:hypothetical protein [Bradyrhizobium sp. CB3035]UWU75482.1 hypothetical protein N2603_36545 [Bradyrhizobium sp. CB3035]